MDPERYLPVLCIGGASATWNQVVEEYLGLVEDRLVLSPEMEPLARRLVDGVEGQEQQTLMLAQHVQREYAYKAIEFGQRALVPNTVTDIVHRKYGDCKDHSLLLYQLVRALGIRASLALVNSGGDVVPGLPSLEQFNHMIVYLPEVAGGRFVDCTDKDVSLALRAPTGLGGKHALLLDPGQPELVTIPDFSPNELTVERAARVVNTVDLEVTETLRFQGYHAGGWRAILKLTDKSERQNLVRRQLAAGGVSVRLKKLKIEDLEQTSQPLIVHLKYVAKDVFQEVDEQLVGRLPAFWEDGSLDEDWEGARVSPFELCIPLRIICDLVLVAPESYTLRQPESLANHRVDELLHWKIQVSRCRQRRPSTSRIPASHGDLSG